MMLSTSIGAAILGVFGCTIADAQAASARPDGNVIVTEGQGNVVIIRGSEIVDRGFRAAEMREREAVLIPDMRLVVESRYGSITIIGDEDAERTHINAAITTGGETQEQAVDRLADVDFMAALDRDGTLRVHAVFPEPHASGDRADFTIRLPGARSVRAEARNGDVEVSNLHSAVIVESRNGAISIRDTSGDLRLTSRNGSVAVEHHDGDLTSTTRNGEVTLTGITGMVSAQSRNGAISIALAPEASEPVEVESRNGAVSVTVGSEFGGRFSIATANGTIDVRDPANVLRSQQITRRGGTIIMNADGLESRIRTRNGPIQIKVSDDP